MEAILLYRVEGFLEIAKQNRDIHMYDPISNAIFNNFTTNPPVHRIVGFMRLHSEIGT